MSSSHIQHSKSSQGEIKTNTFKKHKDFKMDSQDNKNKMVGANNCTITKPNMPANSSVRESCFSRLSSTAVPTNFETVFKKEMQQQQNNDCTTSYFKTNESRTSSTTKFCISVLVLLGAIAVRSSHANPVPTPTAGYRLILHTTQYRQQKHQQLLREQRSLVQPTPRRHHLHHRSLRNMALPGQNSGDSNNGDDNNDQCQMFTKRLQQRIQDALVQANVTFSYLFQDIKHYTVAQHNDTPENVYEQWKKHSLELMHPYASHIKNLKGFKIRPEHITSDKIHLWNKPLTSARLQTEFQHINQALKSIERTYENVLKHREDNKEQVKHDLRRGNESQEKTNERVETINTFFEKVQTNLKQDLYHTRQILEELDVPKNENFPLDYNDKIPHLEWQLFQEHLAIMKYLVAMYTYILQKCKVK